MSVGKISSQTGHAYVGLVQKHLETLTLNSVFHDMEWQFPKVCVGASVEDFSKLDFYLRSANIPWIAIKDPDYTVKDKFVVRNDGNDEPAFTVIGVGPVKSLPSRFSNLKLI